MAKAYTQDEFDSLMEKVEKVDIRVKEYLELAGYEKWARLYAPVNHGWTMTSNIADNQKEASYTYTTLGKQYQEILTLNEALSTRMTVVPSTEHLHMVNDEGRHYTVCLLEKNYSCGRFQVDELPCPHPWAVLKSKFLMPKDYCSDYYKPKSVVITYEVPVYPLPDRS
ncbi:uncharacterized protein [Nicotiana tomentosiformis]|uniref:uncharacterized protein n=1 Tax=Nicotiana tomentosiformis TaxID=4098 RepID=UPI00051B1917|nr:uncharacterized protein LOC104110169 [Nicotiana tomentosiformis]